MAQCTEECGSQKETNTVIQGESDIGGFFFFFGEGGEMTLIKFA